MKNLIFTFLVFAVSILGFNTATAQVFSSAHSVYFDYNSSTLTSKAKGVIDGLTVRLKRGGEYEIVLYGYTDQSGNDDYNKKLSEKRITSVKAHLESNGIPSEKIFRILVPRGKGSPSPWTSSDPERTAELSRQVELIITPKIDVVDPQGAAKPTNGMSTN